MQELQLIPELHFRDKIGV